jgi:hypothetical protein
MDPDAFSLKEEEEGLRSASSLRTLRENLHNLQRKQGGQVPLFDMEYDEPGTTINSITSRLEQVETQLDNGATYPQVSPTLSELPGLVEEVARDIVEDEYNF